MRMHLKVSKPSLLTPTSQHWWQSLYIRMRVYTTPNWDVCLIWKGAKNESHLNCWSSPFKILYRCSMLRLGLHRNHDHLLLSRMLTLTRWPPRFPMAMPTQGVTNARSGGHTLVRIWVHPLEWHHLTTSQYFHHRIPPINLQLLPMRTGASKSTNGSTLIATSTLE